MEKVEVLTEAQPLLKQDEEIKCKQCSKVFLFLVKDQEFYQSKGFYNKPLRCKDCAKANSASRTAAAAIIVTPKFIEPIPPPPKIRTEEEEEEEESGKLEKKKKKKKTTLLLGLVFIEEEEEE